MVSPELAVTSVARRSRNRNFQIQTCFSRSWRRWVRTRWCKSVHRKRQESTALHWRGIATLGEGSRLWSRLDWNDNSVAVPTDGDLTWMFVSEHKSRSGTVWCGSCPQPSPSSVVSYDVEVSTPSFQPALPHRRRGSAYRLASSLFTADADVQHEYGGPQYVATLVGGPQASARCVRQSSTILSCSRSLSLRCQSHCHEFIGRPTDDVRMHFGPCCQLFHPEQLVSGKQEASDSLAGEDNNIGKKTADVGSSLSVSFFGKGRGHRPLSK